MSIRRLVTRQATPTLPKGKSKGPTQHTDTQQSRANQITLHRAEIAKRSSFVSLSLFSQRLLQSLTNNAKGIEKEGKEEGRKPNVSLSFLSYFKQFFLFHPRFLFEKENEKKKRLDSIVRSLRCQWKRVVSPK
jgi:hypothetical protein